jgi:hypothetical protein
MLIATTKTVEYMSELANSFEKRLMIMVYEVLNGVFSPL